MLASRNIAERIITGKEYIYKKATSEKKTNKDPTEYLTPESGGRSFTPHSAIKKNKIISEKFGFMKNIGTKDAFGLITKLISGKIYEKKYL